MLSAYYQVVADVTAVLQHGSDESLLMRGENSGALARIAAAHSQFIERTATSIARPQFTP